MNLAVVDVAKLSFVPFEASEGMCSTSCGLWTLLVMSTKCVIVLFLPGVFIAKSRRSILSGVVSVPLIGNLEGAPAAGCIIPAR